MSDSTSKPSPISGYRLDEGEEYDLTDDLDLEFDGAEDILRSWRKGMRPDPDFTVSESPQAVLARCSRTGALSHGTRALSARDHGCAVAAVPSAAHQRHEGRTGRRDGGWQQLDRLCHPPCARADSCGAADRGTGQAHRRLRGFRASRAHVNTLIAASGDTITARARWLVRNNGYPRSGFMHIDLGPARSWGEPCAPRHTFRAGGHASPRSAGR